MSEGTQPTQEAGEMHLDISQDVLFGITQLALEQVSGLTPASPPTRMGELLTGRRAKGIVIERGDEGLTIDLTVHVRYGLAIPEVAAEAQRSVREAVASMTGLQVRSVNVTIGAVTLPEDSALAPGAERG